MYGGKGLSTVKGDYDQRYGRARDSMHRTREYSNLSSRKHIHIPEVQEIRSDRLWTISEGQI